MSDILENSKSSDEFKKQEVKKFVFQVYDENIDFVEPMTSEQKNNLINHLIYLHRIEEIKGKKRNNLVNIYKNIALTIVLIMIGIPLLLFLINFSFDLTVNNYSDMEKNFQKLFNK